jgi:Domain of unknown function (DUF202)
LSIDTRFAAPLVDYEGSRRDFPSSSLRIPVDEVRQVARARLSASRKGADMSERRSPEAQFQLANERTYLAWLRMALAPVASVAALPGE